MKRALLIATALSAAGGTVCAQPANGGPTGMESCFQSARGADSVCSNPANDAVQRLDCLLKARTTLLECLEHVPQEIVTGSVSPEKAAGKVTSETPSGAAPPELPTATGVPDKPPAVVSSDKSTAAAPSDKPAAAAASPDMTTAGVSSDKPSAVVSPDMPTAAVSSDKPAATASPDPPARAVDIAPKPRDPNWIISETTSPDGKTAIYRDDPVGLLQSLPDGARLKVNVLDEPGPSHEATFQLTGLDAVREKIAVACKWPPAATKVSSEKR